jgi:hypothetical protein
MNKLYVRVQPKSGVSSFYRCAILFTVAWLMVKVDDATANRLHEEQMLETSEKQPEGYEPPTDIEIVANAENTAATGANTETPPVLSDAEKLVAIKTAMKALDKTVEANWTKGGLPNATVLTATLGFDVSATQRDEVWAEVNAELEAARKVAEALASAKTGAN